MGCARDYTNLLILEETEDLRKFPLTRLMESNLHHSFWFPRLNLAVRVLEFAIGIGWVLDSVRNEGLEMKIQRFGA